MFVCLIVPNYYVQLNTHFFWGALRNSYSLKSNKIWTFLCCLSNFMLSVTSPLGPRGTWMDLKVLLDWSGCDTGVWLLFILLEGFPPLSRKNICFPNRKEHAHWLLSCSGTVCISEHCSWTHPGAAGWGSPSSPHWELFSHVPEKAMHTLEGRCFVFYLQATSACWLLWNPRRKITVAWIWSAVGQTIL